MREWIHHHDERWLFVILYVGFAVVLSIWISLFWLVLIVALHFLLECVRQKALRPGSSMVAHALWEVKLDIALVLMAFALTLYMDVILGVVGLQSAARASVVARGGIKAGARVAGWERAIRGVILSADDVAQIARSVALRRDAAVAVAGGEAGSGEAVAAVQEPAIVESAMRGLGSAPEPERSGPSTAPSAGGEAAPTAAQDDPPPLLTSPFLPSSGWSRGDWFAVGLGAASVAAIVVAPQATAHTYATAAGALLEQLRLLP